jgi:hypothetical protein
MGFLDSLWEFISSLLGPKEERADVASYQKERAPTPASTPTGRPAALKVTAGFHPAQPIQIRYRNFQGIEKTFVADGATLRRKKNHIVVQVAPTGAKISLSRDRIQNPDEVQDALPQGRRFDAPWPSARERQVLNYHKKYGTTSALYESIRSKYPDW